MSSAADPIVIRPVVQSDFQNWLPLWEGYNSFYKRTVAPEITQTSWTRFLDSQEPMHALVAEKNGKILGLAHYIFHRNTGMLTHTCYLQDLFTVESARGRGVGRKLIEAVYAKAKASGAPRVYWQTHETNTTAKALYNKVAEYSGFVVFRKLL